MMGVEKDSVSNDTFRFVGFEHALLFWARACYVVVGRKFYYRYGTPRRNSLLSSSNAVIVLNRRGTSI